MEENTIPQTEETPETENTVIADQLSTPEYDPANTPMGETVTASTEEEPAESAEEEPLETDDPLSQNNVQKIGMMLKQLREMVDMLRSAWEASKREYNLTDSQMKLLYNFNEQHKKPKPENLTEEEEAEWDEFNGLDQLTHEDAVEIFGEDHVIIGVDHEVTMDRIREAVDDFFNWMSAMSEYRAVNDSYIKLIELQEEAQIEQLKVIAANEEDPEKKAAMEASVQEYYNRKYLDFLSVPLDEVSHARLIKAFNTQQTIEYWLKRAQDKLKQLKVSTMFLSEISQFEKRFLDKKYEKANNMLLLYFMQTVTYCDCYDKNDNGRNKAVCMVMALDAFVRNTLEDTKKERIKNNVAAFVDQFLDDIPDKKSDDQ
jgi:hypothetical protein